MSGFDWRNKRTSRMRTFSTACACIEALDQREAEKRHYKMLSDLEGLKRARDEELKRLETLALKGVASDSLIMFSRLAPDAQEELLKTYFTRMIEQDPALLDTYAGICKKIVKLSDEINPPAKPEPPRRPDKPPDLWW